MSIRFVYGQDGLRRERIEEERVNYLLDGLAVLCEFDDSLNLLREFVPGVSVCFGSESFYYHYDRLGSVRFVSDSGGSVVCDYVYDAFGNILSSSGTLSQPYQYIGQHGYYREAVFNLYLLGQRWYDSEAGRFISRDPIGDVLYSYCSNNPLNFIDPDGKQSIALPIGSCTTLTLSALVSPPSGAVIIGTVIIGGVIYYVYQICSHRCILVYDTRDIPDGILCGCRIHFRECHYRCRFGIRIWFPKMACNRPTNPCPQYIFHNLW